MPHVVVHTCNPSTWETKAGYDEFKVNLGYTVRTSLKKKQNKTKTGKNGSNQVSTNVWINTMQYINTMEYYSAVQKNEILLFATCLELKYIMLCETSQTQKRQELHDLTHMWNLKM
jgi:hypothetical protein